MGAYMEADLLAWLVADAAITDAIGGLEPDGPRLKWGWRIEGEPVPAATLNKPADPTEYAMEGAVALRTPLVYLDIWGPDAETVLPLALAFRNRLNLLTAAPLQAFVDDESGGAGFEDAPEPDGAETFYRARLALAVRHTPTP